jgi:hypothetical protein
LLIASPALAIRRAEHSKPHPFWMIGGYRWPPHDND